MNFAMTRQFLLVRSTAPVVLCAVACASCARLDTRSEVDVKPIEVKPIHITVDVNVRIDRELDQFFAFEEELAPPPATNPSAPAPTTANGNAS
jgi:hypothetical protein